MYIITLIYLLTLLFGRPGLIRRGGAWAIKESPKPVSVVSLPGEQACNCSAVSNFQQQSLRACMYACMYAYNVCMYVYIYSGAGHIIRISTKS